MDIMKHFLDDVCRHDADYYYEKLDELGEIYQKGDILPIAIIEHDKNGVFFVRFRLGLQSYKVAKLTSALTLPLQALVFEDDFLIHEEYGYLYGDDARKAFIERIQNNAKQKQDEKEPGNGVIYICTEPIFAYGTKTFGKTKIEKFWEEDNGIL